MTTLNDVTRKGHSYRGHEPEDIIAIVENDDLKPLEQLEQAQEAINFIEGARWGPFLDGLSRFFDRLDRDEQELFTRRNPDLVRWISARNRAHEQDPITRWFELAGENLSADGAIDPPLFDRDPPRNDRDLLRDMAFRRRSYRNWSPHEFDDIVAREKIELSRGFAAEIGWRTPDIRDDVSFPIQVEAKEVARELIGRVEAGRFVDPLSDGLQMFARLDRDERRTFAARNPGFTQWMSAYGNTSHLIHGDQFQVPMPALREV